MLADQRIAPEAHRREVERFGDVPRDRRQQRIGRRLVEHVVAVVPPLGVEPGAELGRRPRRRAHGDRRARTAGSAGARAHRGRATTAGRR